MKSYFIVIMLLFCCTIIRGQSNNHLYEPCIEKAEALFKKGKYDEARNEYKKNCYHKGNEIEKNYMEIRIKEISDCENRKQAADQLYKKEDYINASQLYVALFGQSPDSRYLLDQITKSNKHNPYRAVQEQLSELIKILIAGNEQNNLQNENIIRLFHSQSDVLKQIKQQNDSIFAWGNIEPAKRDSIQRQTAFIVAILQQPPPPSNNIFRNQNLAPFGIKQICNNKKDWRGYTFLASQIAIPVALGAGLECAANKNYNRHRDLVSQNRQEHKDYYDKYKDYHNAAIWSGIGSAVIIYGVNILCNYYFTNIEIKPQLPNVPQGNTGSFIVPQSNTPLLGMSINIKF